MNFNDADNINDDTAAGDDNDFTETTTNWNIYIQYIPSWTRYYILIS